MVVDVCVFFFKQKTAYEMRISDWSSDVCSSDLLGKSDVVTGSGIFGPGIAEADNETQVCHRGQMPTAPANGRRSSGGLLLLGRGLAGCRHFGVRSRLSSLVLDLDRKSVV